MILGCIADDFTGATDLANNLVRAGMRVVQTIGVPATAAAEAGLGDVDAVVVALKSRTAPVDEAVAQSLAACRWLRAGGAQQIYFKVCSTFDSTPRGNIGPVAQALMAHLGAEAAAASTSAGSGAGSGSGLGSQSGSDAGPGARAEAGPAAEPQVTNFAIVTPAFPENGRTVFKGHLFVGDVLLSDSPMRHHPLTPMTDANLVRVMQAQLSGGARCGLIEHRTVAQGVPAVRERIAALRSQGVAFAVADAVGDADLQVLAQAAHHLALVVAGSGLAIGIPALHGLAPRPEAAALPPASGTCAVVSGSCSAATNAQVADFIARSPAGADRGDRAFAVDPLRLAAGEDVAGQALAWAAPRLSTGPVLVYATAAPEAVKAVQAQLGVERAGALVEQALARVAQGLVAAGVGQLLVAGGETSGACVQALGVNTLRIGPQIDPGVPWCHATPPTRPQGLHLALKSGNFGGTDFFTRAFEVLG
ncbi:MAG: four-carbon acid sugar kinase family protein [Rubrivivax sp.]|nr:four-carbon acid sugar kinase family protein [Rubrivivax sp.]